MLNEATAAISYPASAIPPRSAPPAEQRVHRLSKNIGTPTALPLTRVPLLEYLSHLSSFSIFCLGLRAIFLDNRAMSKVPKKSIGGAVRVVGGLELGAA
jgi:hypothetical protein